ncbi:hypothetical protein ACHAXT_011002 [Thalassiosira profunda]
MATSQPPAGARCLLLAAAALVLLLASHLACVSVTHHLLPDGDIRADLGRLMPSSTIKATQIDDGNINDSHRRLSKSLPDGGCEITWPQPPQVRIQTAYAASYPGCGARMTWNLVEALTGLWTGDDWDNNARGKRVVTVKTHYPHDAGQLVSWDDEINRALVIIRNPMSAIPSFFNHIYEIKNHLPIHSQRAPVSDWIEWRDRLAMPQIRKYAKFVNYWMERFEGRDFDRIFISYETLTDDNEGPGEAMRITLFLAESEGVKPIDVETVPCVWKAVVKYKAEAPKPQTERRRRLDPKHHDSQRSGPTERPYTPEMLAAMVEMLQGLIERWGERHPHLRNILEGYRTTVQAAYTAMGQQAPQSNQLQTPAKKFHIIQASLPHSGSTILNNLLVGLFDPGADYKKSEMVTKTSDFDLLSLYKQERPKYDEVFFVASNPLRIRHNVLCLEHEELLYNNPQEMQAMVNNLANKVQARFEYFLGPGFLDERKKADAAKRIEAMDSAVAALKDPPADAGLGATGTDAFQVNGKSFHIFQASPAFLPGENAPPIDASLVLTNWLMGLFEPDKDYSFMVNDKDLTVRSHDVTVPIDSTVVTKTHILNLMGLYKRFRPQFDEILFVASSRGTQPETRVNTALCQYDNVLCVEDGELQLSDNREIAQYLADKFRAKFEYFFGAQSMFLGDDTLAASVRRLERMAHAAESLANQPYSASDPKYGVHGGRSNGGNKVTGPSRGRLFYCGGAHGLKGQSNFRYSTFGLFLAKSLFPDFEGDIAVQPENKVDNSYIPLTRDVLKAATEKDLLVVHSHQHCEVPVEEFSGPTLYVNIEYYDIHPAHKLNPNGELTLNYLPPGRNSVVIGPHEDTNRSIRVPYCSMRLWYLHMTGQSELGKILDPLQKPKNSRENFLLYVNSHYIEYRERAARALSAIGTIHTAGKCQGQFEAIPDTPGDDSSQKCVPFEDSQRPSSIQPVSGHTGIHHQHNNMELFSRYRYALVMENTDAPGYVSEKILHAFLSGTVPIYFGSRFVFEIFNSNAFIYFDLDTPQQALSLIQFYEQTPAEYDKMLDQPILARGRETIEKYFSWDETVGTGQLKSRIRARLGLD